MISLTSSALEFKASKRTVLADAEQQLDNAVREALTHYGELGWYEPIIDAAERTYSYIYETEAGEAPPRPAPRSALKKTLAKTRKPTAGTADRIRNAVAHYVVNLAFHNAASDDPEELDLEWVTMHDNRVRTTHAAADGQVQPVGAPFRVGDSELDHPGDTSAPPSEWVGCRCLLRPVRARAGALVASGDNGNSTVIVALPSASDPVHQLGPEESHMTLLFLGASDQIDEAALDAINGKLMAMADVVQTRPPELTVPVRERGELGDDNAQVLHLDVDHSWKTTREEMLNDPAIRERYDSAEQYPDWTPHLTLGYPGQGEISPENPENIHFDRLALWHGDEQFEYAYTGDDVTAPTETEEPIAEPAPEEATPEDLAIDVIPWFGTIVVEGIPSGDGRQFAMGALRNRDLPLPLTYQAASAEGHDGNVVVGKIIGLARIPGEDRNLINAYGTFLQNEHADQAIGMAAEFGRWGVSIDADDYTIEAAVDGEAQVANFTDARIAAACLVTIPAFAEATIQLGDMPDGWMGDGGADAEVEPDAELDPATPGLVASGAFGRGPGWLTDPEATRRIHSYWTSPGQPGYAKIGWGSGGDFNRCRVEVGKYLSASGDSRFINATCAQWHHDALGIWPATHAKQDRAEHSLEDYRGSINIVAAGAPGDWTPPIEWFAEMQFDRITNTTFVDHPEGTEVFGHLADWNGCHTGRTDVCVPVPRNQSSYRLFHNTGGGTMTTGGLVRTGVLTVGGGHASTKLGIRPAMAHYDSTSAAIIDCRVWEDQFGIGFHGWVRPSATQEQRHAFRAGKISGDWRIFDGAQELMLAHVVNLAGFPVVAAGYSVENGEMVGLVAAGMLNDEVEPATFTTQDISRAVAAGIEKFRDEEAAKLLAAGVAERHNARVAQRALAIKNRHSERV